MVIYEIKDAYENDRVLGYLTYYELEKNFYVNIKDGVKDNDLPISLFIYLNENKRYLNSRQSLQWVRSRIIPSNRQNITEILRKLKIDAYDEFTLFDYCDGRSSNDECYVSKIKNKELPMDYLDNLKYLIDDFSYIEGSEIFVFFKNGQIKRCDLKKIVNDDRYDALINNPDRYKDIRIITGGNELSFTSNLLIDCKVLYEKGISININTDDYLRLFKNMLISTKQACEILGCSRQNIADLVKRNKLIPLIKTDKEMLFLRKDIVQRKYK